MFSKIQDSLRFIGTVDASLGPGSAVRENGKKRGEIAKKKTTTTISERSHHFLFQTTARLDPLVYLSFYALLPPLRGRVPGYVDAHDGFWSLSEKTPDGVTNRTSQSKGSIFPQLYHS